MRCRVAENFSQTHITRLLQAGYEWHCIQNEQLCFHCALDTTCSFPRFHLLVTTFPDQFEISIHFDQRSLHHESNRDEPWAYVGARVREELHRVAGFIKGKSDVKIVCHSNLGFVPKFIRNHNAHVQAPKKQIEAKKPWSWQPIVRK
jgi:hypothetical protein